jgi:uncharacterized membrane protein YhiD involved in acid resistance
MGDEGISFHLLLGRNINDDTSIFFAITHIDFVELNMYVATQSGNLCPTSTTKFKAWDSSRVSASIPSGVGFLGAGLIVKSSEKDPITGESHHLVQGITTAAATWYVLI